jgi:hypothetical protein
MKAILRSGFLALSMMALAVPADAAPLDYNAVSKANGGPKPSVAALGALYTG